MKDFADNLIDGLVYGDDKDKIPPNSHWGKEPRYYQTLKEAERYYRDDSDIDPDEMIDEESFNAWCEYNNVTIREVEKDRDDDYQDLNNIR